MLLIIILLLILFGGTGWGGYNGSYGQPWTGPFPGLGLFVVLAVILIVLRGW